MQIKRKIVANRENERTILSIHHDGHPLTCPIKQPVAVQNQFGSMSFIEHNCNSKCVAFNLKKVGDRDLFCCHQANEMIYDVEIETGITEIESNSGLKLIKSGE
jgi:hypothetical protein